MDEGIKEGGLLERLESQTDEALQSVIEQAKALLAKRQAERQAQALLRIRQLAVDHGLHVKARKRPRKRGRPRKTDALT
jgi:hypothetical protein